MRNGRDAVKAAFPFRNIGSCAFRQDADNKALSQREFANILVGKIAEVALAAARRRAAS